MYESTRADKRRYMGRRAETLTHMKHSVTSNKEQDTTLFTKCLLDR